MSSGGRGKRRVVYCIVPRELAEKLHEPLRRHFADEPSVEVIVEQRTDAERRAGAERRKRAAKGGRKAAPDPDRRQVRAPAGRRSGERRAELVAVRPLDLPRRAQRHTDRIAFVERLEPSDRQAEDADTARLVARCQAGEEEAFGTVYTRYFDRLYAYLKMAVRDPHEAEDLTHDVFVSALEALPRYEERGRPFRAWLFRIARNAAINHLRTQGRIEVMDPAELQERQEASGEAAELETLDWITDGELLMFVERLPLAQQQVLVLNFLLGLTTADSASTLGRSEQDVRSLQHRALTFLRKRFGAIRNSPPDHDPRKNRMQARVKPAFVLRERRFSLD